MTTGEHQEKSRRGDVTLLERIASKSAELVVYDRSLTSLEHEIRRQLDRMRALDVSRAEIQQTYESVRIHLVAELRRLYEQENAPELRSAIDRARAENHVEAEIEWISKSMMDRVGSSLCETLMLVEAKVG